MMHHDAGLVGAAPRKEGQLMLMMLAMFLELPATPGQLMLMMLA